MRRLAPYGLALGGALAITGAIGIIKSEAPVSGLSAFYLLLVLWLGARWGRGPAVAGSLAAFLLYGFYFVPPVGTLTVAGPPRLSGGRGCGVCGAGRARRRGPRAGGGGPRRRHLPQLRAPRRV